MEKAFGYNQYNQWVEKGRKEYQYDTNNIDPSVSEYAGGRLAAVTSKGPFEITYLFGYTRGGLIKTKQMYYDQMQETLTATWTYNDEGKMTGVTYPSGRQFTYGYDTMGRPNTLTSNSGVGVGSATYNAAGQLTQFERGGSPKRASTTRTVNSRASRLSTWTWSTATRPGRTTGASRWKRTGSGGKR